MSKIIQTVCTLGPASQKPETLEKLISSGMNIARFNFSHTTPEQFLRIKSLIEKYNQKLGKKTKILLDLQGPRMRVGLLPEEGLNLKEGEEVTFSTGLSDNRAIHIDNPHLHEDIEPGQPMYLSNGEIELKVVSKKGNKIMAKVLIGGVLYSRKGVNVPETKTRARGLTDKDLKDVKLGVENGVDFIALSFVGDKSDVRELREKINDPTTGIVAKIERRAAIANLEKIIKASDLIMVARGDLGVEFPLPEIPFLQKEIISKANRFDKPAIVATQMLASMVNHPHPTRAEVTDVANAVLDGAWGVMLSQETAFGHYPVQSLDYLTKITQRAAQFSSG
jgi:pyruvate kinase